ncbi:hypothetical protein ID866_610 [Astraeus odoratus]|nr:hypothetical protein ID866_610 [Astraeus odoratus]
MLPQATQHLRPQNTHSSPSPSTSSFVSQNPPLDPAPYFNLDSDAAAKQMAALNAASLQRHLGNVPNGRQPPNAHISLAGTTPTPFLQGMPPSIGQPNNLPQALNDTSHNMPFGSAGSLSGHSNVQLSGYPTHPNASIQPTSSSFDPTLQANMASRQGESMVPKQKQRSFLSNLAGFHLSRGHPLPPSLTGVPYPNNYDPANSPWKTIECPPGELGIFRLGSKDIDLMKFWSIVVQAGGGAKVPYPNPSLHLCYEAVFV